MGNRVQTPQVNIEVPLLHHQNPLPSHLSPSIIPTATLRPSIHLKRESIKLTRSNTLSFEYFSQTEISLTIYFFAIESLKSFGTTEFYYIDTEKYPNPVHFSLPTGQPLCFPSNLLSFNPSQYTIQELSFADKKTYPIIIEIRPKNKREVENTYCKFECNEGEVQIRVLRQKLTMNEKNFELSEIFGFTTETVQNCVVCLTEAVSTLVLPCRHYCLCLHCSDTVRTQHNSRCPICRIPVETLLNIK